MNAWSAIALFDVALAVLMVVEWRLLSRHHPEAGWRSRAPLVAFWMATVALLLELSVAAVALRYRSLGALDEASQHGGSSASVAVVVLGSLDAGILSLATLIVALLAKGQGRVSMAVCSATVLIAFLVTLVLAINSFH